MNFEGHAAPLQCCLNNIHSIYIFLKATWRRTLTTHFGFINTTKICCNTYVYFVLTLTVIVKNMYIVSAKFFLLLLLLIRHNEFSNTVGYFKRDLFLSLYF